jgi:type IV pilus assembly protein PilM
MIPWNPIHRYAGMTSLFDSIDEQPPPRDLPLARYEGPGATPQPQADERAPLGFVDVRAEATGNSDGTADAGNERPAAQPELAPKVELAAVPDADDRADESEEEKVPFYKREISLGRKKAEEPAAELSIAPIVEPEEAPEAPAQDDESAGEKVPFYKRELSFRRSSESTPELEIVAEPLTGVDAELELETAEPLADAEPMHAEADLIVIEPERAPVAPNDEQSDLEAVHEAVASEREPQPEAEVEPEPVAAPVAAVEEVPAAVQKVPMHKRQISLGKSAKQTSSEKKNRGGRKTGRKVVGLKIGASQLAAAVVQDTDSGHELLELARTPLEPGIVLDGEVRDADALVAALKAFFADQKLPTRDVRIGIASNRIGVRTLDIGGIDDESRFDNAVRFKAHEVLPIAASDSVLDYRVLEEKQFESGETSRRVLLVVAPRDQVAPYVEVADRSGLKLAGIDLEALGLLRAFVDPGMERLAGGTSTVVVSIGHEATTLLVSGGGVCEFTRVFDWGGSTLQEAIAQELDLHPAEAATILRSLSLSGTSRRVEGIDDDQRNRALEATRLRLTPFARELVSSLQFYQTQPESLGIGEIVITGGTSQLEGLADALHQMIGVQVRVGNPLERLVVRKGVESGFEHSLGSLAVPIGLAIDDDPMRSVDLTPRDIARKRSSSGRSRKNLAPVLIPVAAVVPLAALGFMFFQAHGKVSHRQSELSSLQTTLASLPQPKGPQIDASLQGPQAARASAVAQVLGTRTSWDGMLRDLSRVLPANVWLTELRATVATPLTATVTPQTSTAAAQQTGTVPVPAAPTGVTITGHTFSQSDVAVLLARLVALPSLGNVQLSQADVATAGKKTVVEFTILADLRGAGGGA